jgi:hypothetical protein
MRRSRKFAFASGAPSPLHSTYSKAVCSDTNRKEERGNPILQA